MYTDGPGLNVKVDWLGMCDEYPTDPAYGTACVTADFTERFFSMPVGSGMRLLDAGIRALSLPTAFTQSGA